MPRIPAPILALPCLAFLSCALFASCGGAGYEKAVIWTDLPELAIAVELFDARAGGPRVELAWKADLAEALGQAGGKNAEALPSLVVGRGLESDRFRDRLDALDYLIDTGSVKRAAFYPELLEGGIVGGKRVLLPVSFNLPAIVFRRGEAVGGAGFTLSLAEMSGPSAAFNAAESGGYAAMGFSPRWRQDFFVAALDSGAAGSKGASFREGRGAKGARGAAPELAWDAEGLAASISALASWSAKANGQAVLEDDFAFKYLYAPPYRWLKEGRVLYAYMDSSELFTLSGERKADLDFRWFASHGRVRVSEGSAYAGLPRGAPGRKSAEAFLRWLFSPEAQKAMLERASDTRSLENSFGIAGGFSSIRLVNEEAFPMYYPELLGHAPQSLALPGPFPDDWRALESGLIGPWALEAAAAAQSPKPGSPGSLDPSGELAKRLADRQAAARP
jgi:hypothetical protein